MNNNTYWDYYVYVILQITWYRVENYSLIKAAVAVSYTLN